MREALPLEATGIFRWRAIADENGVQERLASHDNRRE